MRKWQVGRLIAAAGEKGAGNLERQGHQKTWWKEDLPFMRFVLALEHRRSPPSRFNECRSNCIPLVQFLVLLRIRSKLAAIHHTRSTFIFTALFVHPIAGQPATHTLAAEKCSPNTLTPINRHDSAKRPVVIHSAQPVPALTIGPQCARGLI